MSKGPGLYNFAVRVSDGVVDTGSGVALNVNEVNSTPDLGGNNTFQMEMTD